MSTSEQLISVLEEIAGIIQKAQINLKKCSKSRLTKGYIETRQRNLEEYWTTFRSTHQELVKCTPAPQRADMSYFVNDNYSLVEDLYLCVQGDLTDMLDTLTSVRPTRSTCPQDITMCEPKENNNIVKLPRIQLPIFTGTYEGWPTFNDLFLSLIHNNTSLSKVQKLHYLKSSVVGEAEALLRNVQVTEDNYDQAWETLRNRYGNKRLIINTLLKKLFLQKKITVHSASQIKNILDTTSECLNSIKNQNISIESWDPVIIFFVVQKLDAETHKDWEEYTYSHNSNELPTWDNLKMFLEKKFRTLELTTATSVTTNYTTRERGIKEKSFHVTSRTLPASKVCSMCDDNHTLSHCMKFSKLLPNERSEFVKKTGLCYNCLMVGHTAWKCRAPVSCHICSRRHHSLLHQPTTTIKPSDKKEAQTHSKQASEEIKHPLEHKQISQGTISSYFTMKMSTTLLATAMVHVRSNNGQHTILRALIDQGSQANFISERATQVLNLKRTPSRGTIIGVGSTHTPISSAVEFELLSKYEQDFKLPLKAYVIMSKHITKLPSDPITVPFKNWPHLQGLTLADPDYSQPGHIDMLLGVEVCAHIFKSEIVKGPPGSPCAQNTSLGWILFGKIQDESSSQAINVMHHLVDDVHDMLRNLWEVDSQEKKSFLTKEEELCENIYRNNFTKNKEGRYIVKLPFKTENIKSTEGNTKEIAFKRLQHLEKRFERNEWLKSEYTKAMNNYFELNRIEEIPEVERDDKAVYLPHHGVVREDKETSKLRIVFDASAKGINNISLNDELLVGPQLQEDLRYLIMRWRFHKICFIADIQTMYLEILVRHKDADYQRILWRCNSNDPVKEYRLLRVTFGTASAPYLAVRTLHQVADDEGGEEKYDRAVQAIKQDFYMDDLLSGEDTVTEAVDLAKNITNLLEKGGFILRKWSSNSEEFLKEFEPEKRSTHVNIDIKLDGKIRALGLTWNMGDDKFEYELNLPDPPKVITKRNILGDIQRLFDPLGWLAPVFIPAKMIIQRLWLKKLSWDEAVDPEIKRKWLEIRQGLQELKDLKIDRWIQTTKDTDDMTIHGFCDASIHAYGAVAYLRVRTQDGKYKVSLIAAKARVAPVKPLTLPRLELCGALLLSKLLKQISEATRIPSSQIYCWSDSTVVLSWLNGDPNRWQTFVRNRVVAILDNIGNKWSHVESSQNPADIASRGSTVSNLKKYNIWWQGPNWLIEEKIKFNYCENLNTNLEIKNNIEVNLKIDEGNNQNVLLKKFEEFDTILELLNAITYCTRFLNFKRDKTIGVDSVITVEELEKSLIKCIVLVQGERFSEEIKDLNKINRVKNRSKLKLLNPYLDSQKILRVGGRIRNSNLSADTKHPIILDDKNYLTRLIVADAHKRTLHGGVQLMINYIRSKYWILNVKKLVKRYISKCLICARQRATVHNQLMGDLPKVRVTPARAFLHSGVDFAGPYNVLMSKGRGAKTNKAYIAIFVCMATKAIHLELVGDLTSAAFIGAFRRFVSRRGICNHLWSDQGRNFIGANKELLDAWKEANLQFHDEIQDLLVKDGTQWHFVPAYSPNFGGLWEAGVKSMKYHLRRVLKTNLTFEEMTTILCQIEACLNSRPLCPIDDKECESVLTPGHFLIGESPLTVPSPDLKDIKLSYLSRWQYTQKLLNDFWKAWQKEYLSRLQQRPKWLKRTEEFEIGQIVLIKTDGLPPGKWLLGRIVDKHPGLDGIARVYSVKSGSNIVKRSISKLCLMPVDTES